MFGLSREHREFYLRSRCPRCKARIAFLNLRKPDGQQISPLTLLPLMDRGTVATCPKCAGSWQVFENAAPPPPPPPPPPVTARPTVTLRDTGRILEPLGQEVRVIDNSGSDVVSVRRMKASKRWLRRSEVAVERTSTTTDGFTLDPGVLASLKSEVQTALRSSHSVSEEQEDLFEEEIEVTVPGRTAVQIVLSWNRIWQQGTATCGLPTGQWVEVPYQLVVGVTFDQHISDLAG